MLEEKVTGVPEQIDEPGFAEMEIPDVGLITNGILVADAVAVVLLKQPAGELALTLTDCNCTKDIAVVLKLLPVAPGTSPLFMLHW
jgi:hypothetical protein